MRSLQDWSSLLKREPKNKGIRTAISKQNDSDGSENILV